MNALLLFLKDFFKNKGLMVFLSVVIEKLIGFINVVFVVHLISEKDYGSVTLIASVFGVMITMNGLGTIQGLMRFGALAQQKEKKQNLISYIFKEGIKKQIGLVLLFVLISMFYELKYSDIWIVVLAFAVRMLGYYFYSFILAYYRVYFKNEKFSITSIFTNVVGLVLSFLLTYFYGKNGYLLSLSIFPWFSLFFFRKDIMLYFFKEVKELNKKEFWSYSFNSSINYFFSELMFLVDIFLIGVFLDETAVANYKVAIILPMNLMFLPMIFIQTDFPKLVANSKNKQYLTFYIRNYYKLFIPLCFLLVVVGFFVKDWILPFVFGQKYEGNGWIFFIVLISVACNMCFRNLYGNLLSAVGWAKQNSIISIASLLLLSLLGLILIRFYGIIGIAGSLAFTFISMGIGSGIIFKKYLKQL